MFHYLLQSGLVDALSVFGEGGSQGLVASGRDVEDSAQRAEEWRMQGQTLRERGLFALAAKCFEQAGDVSAHLEAAARETRQRAVRAATPAERQVLAMEAASLFLRSLLSPTSPPRESPVDASTSGFSGTAAPRAVESMASCGRCLFDCDLLPQAGDVLVAAARLRRCLVSADIGEGQGEMRTLPDAQTERLVQDGVRCYRKAGKLNQAVDVLLEMQQIEQALRLLKDEHLYQRALEILDTQAHVPPSLDPALSAEAFLREAATALGLACSSGRARQKSRPTLQTGGRRRGGTEAEAAAAARRNREEAEQAFLHALDRLPARDGRRLLQRYRFLHVLEKRLIQDQEFCQAAHVMLDDGRGALAVALLESLPKPSDDHLRLAALLATQVAFMGAEGRNASSGGSVQEGSGSCVVFLSKAAQAISRVARTEQTGTGEGIGSHERRAACMYELLLRIEIYLRSEHESGSWPLPTSHNCEPAPSRTESALKIGADDPGAGSDGLLARVGALATGAGCAFATALALNLEALKALGAGARARGRCQGSEMNEQTMQPRCQGSEMNEQTMQRVREAVGALRTSLRHAVGVSGRDEAEMRLCETMLGFERAADTGIASPAALATCLAGRKTRLLHRLTRATQGC